MQTKPQGMIDVIPVEQAKTLDGLFRERVQRSPENVAYRYFNAITEQWASYTWGEMNRFVSCWQAALGQETLVRGDRVAVMMRNCPEWVMFEQAALGLGLVVGVGGGFLIVPALVLLAGVPMSSAVGTSLAVIALNSFTGFGKYQQVLADKGLALDWYVLLLIAAIGVVGSFAGNRLGRRLPQATLRRLFGLFLVVMGVFVAADAVPRLLH